MCVCVCVCDCEYQNIVNEVWAWVPRRLKLTHIIIMITAAVAIVIATDIERKQFFRVFISLLLPPSPPSLPLLSIITMSHTRCAHRLRSSISPNQRDTTCPCNHRYHSNTTNTTTKLLVVLFTSMRHMYSFASLQLYHVYSPGNAVHK